jgi:cell fate regulator YaaT (PSP1 superfamily)
LENYLIIYGKPRFLGYLSLEGEEALERGTRVHAQTDRGEELVVVIGKPKEDFLTPKKKEKTPPPRGNSGKPHPQETPIQKVDFIAKASPELLEEREFLEKDEAEILSTARKILRKHDLAMKLVDAEFLLGKKKLFLYFTSEDRVDFRSYVRDLAREFKTRIELRQIGIRDEARVVGGLASCGRPCCCSYWLQQFSPICIRMVKEQNLALNPTKISGICGRLMCCMSYEHFMYKDLWDNLPNPGTKIRGPEATYVLSGVDISSQSVRIFGMGREIILPVDKYTAFCAAIQEGKEWEGESPPTSRKNTPTSSREIEKRGASTLSSQENSPESPASPEQKEEEAQGDRGGESPKKKLQRRRKGTQTKTLGTGSSSEKKEEDPSGKKQTSSEGSQKGREGKRKGDPTAPQREGASRKKGPRKPSSQKNRGASPSSPSEGREQKKGAPDPNSSPQGKKEAGSSSSSNRKKRRRPRKASSRTGDAPDTKVQKKTSQEGKPQE